MLFSIVTPFYNSEQDYVDKLLNSILEQTYTKWEWLVTDDFSKDESYTQRIKDLEKIDNRIHYIESAFKKELFWNPHKHAKGDIVFSIDSDDSILPKTLEVYHRMYLKYTEVLLMTCESNIYNRENGMYVGNPYYNNTIFKSIAEHSNNYTKIWSCDYLGLPHGKSWKNINIDFNPNNQLDVKHIQCDWVMLSNLEEYGKYLHIPRTLHDYSYRPDSISRVSDDYNEHLLSFDNYAKEIIERRKNKDIHSIYRIYEPIFDEALVFYFSKMNQEKVCQNLSFISKNEISYYKQELLKDLYFDHNLHFNEINNDIDYYYVQLKSTDDIQYFEEIFNELNIKTRKEIIFSIVSQDLYNRVNNFLNTLGVSRFNAICAGGLYNYVML